MTHTAQRRQDDRNAIARQVLIAGIHGLPTTQEGRFRKHSPRAAPHPSHRTKSALRAFGGAYGLTPKELKDRAMLRAETRHGTLWSTA